MRYFYTATYADFRAAQRTYIRSSTARRVRFHLLTWGLLVLGTLVLALMLSLHLENTPLMPLYAGLGGGLLGGGIATCLLRPWRMRRAYEAFNGKVSEARSVYFEVQAETLLSGIVDRSEGRFQRAAICNFVEDETTALLFFSKKRFLYIPKTALPQEGWNDLKQWLQLPGAPEKC
jgi:hypothetical protein